jgi:hypothetical protein
MASKRESRPTFRGNQVSFRGFDARRLNAPEDALEIGHIASLRKIGHGPKARVRSRTAYFFGLWARVSGAARDGHALC